MFSIYNNLENSIKDVNLILNQLGIEKSNKKSLSKLDFLKSNILNIENYLSDNQNYSNPSLNINTGFYMESLTAIQTRIRNIKEFVNRQIPFISKWNLSAGSFTIITNDTYTYNYTIDWGDSSINKNVKGDAEHVYETDGEYEITISGKFPVINVRNDTRLIEVSQLGNVGWELLDLAFRDCSEITKFSTKGLEQNTDIISCDYTWANCSKLVDFDSSGLTNVLECAGSWQNCDSLVEFDTSNMINVIDITDAWSRCRVLSSFNSSGLINTQIATRAWASCIALRTFDSSFLYNCKTFIGSWFSCTLLESFDATPLVNAENFFFAWNNCSLLSFFDGSTGLSKVTNLGRAWTDCLSLNDKSKFIISGFTNRNLIDSNITNAFGGTIRSGEESITFPL